MGVSSGRRNLSSGKFQQKPTYDSYEDSLSSYSQELGQHREWVSLITNLRQLRHSPLPLLYSLVRLYPAHNGGLVAEAQQAQLGEIVLI